LLPGIPCIIPGTAAARPEIQCRPQRPVQSALGRGDGRARHRAAHHELLDRPAARAATGRVRSTPCGYRASRGFFGCGLVRTVSTVRVMLRRRGGRRLAADDPARRRGAHAGARGRDDERARIERGGPGRRHRPDARQVAGGARRPFVRRAMSSAPPPIPDRRHRCCRNDAHPIRTG
jgi:hypothetical protein